MSCNIKFEKIRYHNKTGFLYRVSNNNPITLKLDKVTTIFGLEEKYKNQIIKWCVNSMQLINIRTIEEQLLNSSKDLGVDEIVSKVIIRQSYNIMLETKISKTSSCSEVITHNAGDLVSYNDIVKNNNYNVELKLNFVSVKDKKLYYNLKD